jgi:hypothetical protein
LLDLEDHQLLEDFGIAVTPDNLEARPSCSGAMYPSVPISAVDTKGARSCEFVVLFGRQGPAVQRRRHGDANADLTGSRIDVADDDDDKIVRLEIHDPREHYLKCVVSLTTQNSVVDGIIRPTIFRR